MVFISIYMYGTCVVSGDVIIMSSCRTFMSEYDHSVYGSTKYIQFDNNLC